MTEKDKEINELRRENANLRALIEQLRYESEKDSSDLVEAVRTIYDHCVRTDVCKRCELNRTEGCIITHSPYQWRMKDL